MFCFPNRSRRESGVAALPVILLISGIILEIVAASAFLAFSFSSGSFGTLLATEALFGARAGADDAIYRIIKNNYSTSYSLTTTTGSHTVVIDITVEKDPIDLGSCSTAWGCRYRIYSTGRVLFRERKIEVVLAVDPNTREIRRESFKEVEI
ncbi:MAG: hypothetical protein PHS16_01995 [Candidatus Colwellbacteria bacterium]|jgi:hypothetical protein|nr:hypothetical protein [Candidatus Colwellbacteria bacterium]MCK9497712.1 hypothetical protein [Candidatus Colwellbacteria bacterium]MDD3752688.1 hypothetical protein [Candidatus Colwellbacteria bacterium]MDD4818837.1 hypothetical protein [Candidatus Colwellbacteria bacterium]